MKFAKTFSTILVAASLRQYPLQHWQVEATEVVIARSIVIGKAGVATKTTRTVTVEMSDNMRYTPSEIQVKKGETIRFVVKNVGKSESRDESRNRERVAGTSRADEEIPRYGT